MSFFDSLAKHSGTSSREGLIAFAAKHPQVLAAAVSLLSSRSDSVGGQGGLGGLISSFQRNGLGYVVSSWISTGQNKPVSSDQVVSALGPDDLNEFARKAGIDVSQAGPLLAALLPMLVDHVTPEGKVPASQGLEDLLGSLLSGQ